MTDGEQEDNPGVFERFQAILEKAANAVVNVATILVAVGVVYVLYRVISGVTTGNWPVLKDIAELAYARGLITLTITVATIAIAVLLVVTAVFGIVKTDEQFRRAREVFSVLGGVLGTIVGFYFGSAEKGPAGIKLAQIQVVPSVQGQQVVTAAAAGTSPYHYTIQFAGKEVASGDTKDGLIVADIAGPRPSAITVRVEDAAKATGIAVWTAPAGGAGNSESGNKAADPSPKP